MPVLGELTSVARRGGMYLSRSRMVSVLLAAFILLAVSGYYVVLIVQANVGIVSSARGVTIPLRVVLMAVLGTAIALDPVVRPTRLHFVFLAFAFLYLLRIIIEMIGGSMFHISPVEMGLYFISFCVLPFLVLSNIRLSVADASRFFYCIAVPIVVLSALTVVYYGEVIGAGRRISSMISRDANYISPLALSYCGALGMGMAMAFWLGSKGLYKRKWFATILFSSSTVPFYLGASRGSVVALLLSAIFLFAYQSSMGQRFKAMAVILTGILVLSLASDIFGTAVFDRVASMGDDIESGSSSMSRLVIWRESIAQFAETPLFGNSLEVQSLERYPHNILIEVMITTGIVGLIPFVLMFASGYRLAVTIVKKSPRYAWMAVFFIQSVVQAMFSGALYSSGWVFISIALMASFDRVNIVSFRSPRSDVRGSSSTIVFS